MINYQKDMVFQVSLDLFHKFICSLDYYRDFDENLKTDTNLNLEIQNNLDDLQETVQDPNQKKEDLQHLPKEYQNYQEYIQLWEKLFKIEAKAQILKEQLDQEEQAEEFQLIGSQKMGPFDLYKYQSITESQVKYAFGDLVLVTKQQQQTENYIGIIEQRDLNLYIKTYFDKTKDQIRFDTLNTHLTQDSLWYIKKICSLQTLNREYQSLNSINFLKLRNSILKPKNFENQKFFKIPQSLEEKLIKTYNPSQMNAIQQTLKVEGVTLIQGPPGTGKTTTVLGTVSVLLNSLKGDDESKMMSTIIEKQKEDETKHKKLLMKKRPWLYQKNYQDWRDSFPENPTLQPYVNAKQTDQFIDLALRKVNYAPPEKILICAPSNTAIDEIVRKILEKGLFNGNGQKIDPFIVRIGPNFNEELERVSFDYLVEQEVKISKGDKQLDEIKHNILSKAKIVCGTLSSTGSLLLSQSDFKFDTVIVDEAAQAVEISTLIPLKYGTRRLILIGDNSQLPATIFSKICEKYNYNMSLFERLANFLPIMHPLISNFISQTFYQGQIKDSDNIMQLIGKQNLYSHLCFQPFVFIHVPGQEKFSQNSFKNQAQCQAIVELYKNLKKSFPNFNLSRLGIISPYSRQVQQIKKRIANFDRSLKCNIEVNTVDGFQGREKDIIIFSTVRSNKQSNKPTIGFLSDVRRMNVSLSRARISLIVVGDMRTLNINKQWRGLIDFAVQNQAAFNTELAKNQNIVDSIQKQASKLLIKQKTQEK